MRGPCRPGKAQPPPGEISAQSEMSLLALRLAGLQLLCYFRTDCAPNIFLRYVTHGAGSAQGGQSPPPLYPGLRPATSPLRGAFDLSLQASGRAEAASLQTRPLSPHPCGLPRPSGNVSAMLRPPAPAVSAAPAPAVIWGCRPGKAQPPPGINAAPCLMASPGGAALTGPTRCEPVRGPGRPGKTPAATRRNIGATGNVPARAALSGLQLLCYFRADCAPG